MVVNIAKYKDTYKYATHETSLQTNRNIYKEMLWFLNSTLGEK